MASFTMESGTAHYVLDASKSRFVVRATATGLLSALGHNPSIAIRSFKGEAWFRPDAPEQSSLRVEVDTSSLAVTGEVNEKDRREMERAMRQDVLETDRFPVIRFESSSVVSTKLSEASYRMKIRGPLEMHGVTHDVEIPCTVIVSQDTLRVNGEFMVRQTDYRIKLVSVAGGTLKLKDELKFTFDIPAQRTPAAAQG